MKIIVDVMGGDKAPEETVKGVIAAARELPNTVSYLMVGNRADIERIAAEEHFDLSLVEIVHTDSVITMEDDPISAVRGKKQDSSMSTALRLLAEGKGDAVVSTGNTGALFTGATLLVRKVKGIQRAGIATLLPLDNPMLLFDSGANVTVTPENLEQFAVIGSAYMKKVFGIERPRVGLLNNGTESCKGTELQQTAHKLLSENPDIHFVGNIEGGMLFDSCDVLVSDGFTGNIFLKNTEGTVKLMLKKLKGMFKGSLRGKLAYLLLKPDLKRLKAQIDPAETGGAPILGIAKPVFKAHGSSDARSFKNAIRQAVRYVESNAIEEVCTAAQVYAERRRAAKDAQKQTEE